jgi:hypothetical protein
LGILQAKLYSHVKRRPTRFQFQGYDFWKVPGTKEQLANFSPIAQVDPLAPSAKIWLTPETVFF